MHCLKALGLARTAASFAFSLTGSMTKHFHNLKVSSAPADKTVVPSGEIARCKTLAVCPLSSATFKFTIKSEKV